MILFLFFSHGGSSGAWAPWELNSTVIIRVQDLKKISLKEGKKKDFDRISYASKGL